MVHLYESQRLEVLADMFVERLAAWGRDGYLDPFRPETVIPQNPAIGRWLSYQIASRTGISAGLSFPLAGRFIRSLLESAYGDPLRPAHFEKGNLLLRLFETLPVLIVRPEFLEVRGFLGRGMTDERLYELSAVLADLYDRSMIYRPDLLLGWEDGKDPDGWPAILWRELSGSSRPLHRARMMESFFRTGGKATVPHLPPRISLFGLTGMAPRDLLFFRTLGEADLCDVHLYFLNPCEEYWGDIVPSRVKERALPEKKAILETGAPLLSSWGEPFRNLHQSLADLPLTSRLFPSAPPTLLGSLQDDLRTLSDRGALIRECALERRVVPLRDRSLEVISCTSPVREVEMLKDRLLALFSEIPGLSPEDVVVLAPDIGRYAGIIRSVFGEEPGGESGKEREPEIPFVISDRRELLEEPAFEALLLLLRLPRMRLTAPLAFRLLSVPLIAEKFGLAGIRPSRLQEILWDSGFRWGLSGSDRPSPYAGRKEQSLVEGRDRILLGYACGEEALPKAFFLSPLALPEDREGEIAGGIARFSEALEDLLVLLSGVRPASEWPLLLRELLDTFFRLDSSRSVDRALAAIPDRLARDFTEAGASMTLSSAVLSRHLEKMAGAGDGKDRFLSGGVTFGRMVPLRSIPFRVVCLLGMNDADFPRPSWPPSFDWLASHPEPGDRSVREDDRTLFLEALLSARDILWISYVGIEIRDGSHREPSVLVRQLMDQVAEGFEGENGPILSQITLESPLDPLSPDHYSREADPRLRSYSRPWRRALENTRRRPSADPVFFDPSLSWGPAEPKDTQGGAEGVSIPDLRSFIRDPARHFLVRQMGFPPSERPLRLEEAEPFVSDPNRTITARLRGGEGSFAPLPWPPLRGLVSGRAEREAEGYRRTLGERLDIRLPEGSVPFSRERLDGTFHGVRFAGTIEGLAESLQGGRFLIVERWPWSPFPGDFLEAYVGHLLCALFLSGYRGCALTGKGGKKEAEKDPTRIPLALWRWSAPPRPEAARQFLPYFRAFRKGRRAPLPFDPEASRVFADTLRENAGPAGSPAWKLASGKARELLLSSRVPPFNARSTFFDPRSRSPFWTALAFSGRDLPGEIAFGLWSLRLWDPLLANMTEEGTS